MSYSYGELDAGSGGVKVATDRIATKDYQIVKIATGGEGTATELANANPLPVSDAGGSLTVDGPLTDAQLRAAAVPVSGTFYQATQPVSAAALPLPSGAATSALQGGGLPAALGAGGGLKVDGSGTALPVSGTFWQATQPVSVASLPLPAGAATSAEQDATQALIGEVQATPTANTVLGRLKDLLTGIVLAAGTALLGKVSAGQDSSSAYDGATALTPKFKQFSTASTGDQAIISAVVGKKLRVLALTIIAGASTNSVYINDGTATLHGDATRKLPLDVTGATGPGGYMLPYCPVGWFETGATNRPLNINLASANAVLVTCVYVEV